MKIAISSTGRSIDAQVDARFGRCPFFILVDPASGDVEVLENEASTTATGAGIQAAQMVANAGVEAVITGNLGPKAADVLAAAGLKVYTGRTGTVRQVMQQYGSGGLEATSSPSPSPPANISGAGGSAAIGTGRAGGRGMGRGRGRRCGPGGRCICPDCGGEAPHQPGVPCFEARCPKCGAVMRRS